MGVQVGEKNWSFFSLNLRENVTWHKEQHIDFLCIWDWLVDNLNKEEINVPIVLM